jgi:hypothetical protein
VRRSRDGSVASGPSPPKHTDKSGPGTTATGSGSGGGNGHTGDGSHQGTPNRHGQTGDFRDNLRNSFHRPKLNFPRYDGETDPLPWLNRCESYFMGTRTMAVEQVWLASLHMDEVTAEWNYALEHDYGVLP